MLARINKFLPHAAPTALLVLAAAAFSSCASKQQPPLISDNTGRESALPWAEQEKWEGQGQLGTIAERFDTR